MINNTKKKILHLSNNPEASGFGGTETFMSNMITRLPQYEHVMIGGDLINTLAKSLNLESYNHTFNRGHGGFMFRIKELIFLPFTIIMSFVFIIKFRNVLRSTDLVILSNGSLNSVVTYVPLIKFFYKLPIIYVFHGNYPSGKFYNFSILGMYWKYCLDLCQIVYISNSVKDSLKKLKLENVGRTIHNGTNISPYKNINKYDKSIINFGFIGRFSERKGVLNIIQIVKEYNHAQKINIFFKGEGELLDDVKKLIDLNHKVNIIIEKFSKDTSEFYNNLDCLLMPSHSEGFSLVRLEALERGVPVISSDIASFQEVVEIVDQKELMFKVGDAKDLLNNIYYYIDNYEQYDQQYRSNLHEVACKYFNNDVQFDEYSKLFEELIINK
jgi:glycosyltransferase involved in cell wall biosynthesis